MDVTREMSRAEDVESESDEGEADEMATLSRSERSRTAAATVAENENAADRIGGKWRARLTLRTIRIAVAAAFVAVLAIVGALSWRLYDSDSELDQMKSASAADAHAEKVALDYATGAAEMDFRDVPAWRKRLIAGTSDALSKRLDQAAQSMEQIIVPLQWTSTSRPITARVVSESGGVYSVLSFVSVSTKNSQAPDGIESTATYRMNIDSGNGWKITDLSGVTDGLGAAASGPAAPR